MSAIHELSDPNTFASHFRRVFTEKAFDLISRLSPSQTKETRFSPRPAALYLALTCLIGLALSSCLSIAPTPPPTPILPTPAPPTPTVAFPTLEPSPTSTASPSSTPTPDLIMGLGEELYSDSFTSNHGWQLGESGEGAASLLQGRFVIAVHQEDGIYFATSPAGSLQNFNLEVEVRAELCRPGDEFGVFFRMNPAEEHYRLLINCDGSARISRVLLSDARLLALPVESSSIIPGPLSDHRVTIRADGPFVQVWVNGVQLFSVQDPALLAGEVGFLAHTSSETQLTVSFDNLLICALSPTPTPTATP